MRFYLGSPVRLAPITTKRAILEVKRMHRHLPRVQGGLFSASVVDGEGEDERLLGVAIAGHPPRVWMGTGVIVILRVACVDAREHPEARNACSMLYGSLCRAAKALGYVGVWTYTLQDEPGESLRGAGFVEKGMTDGGEHDRPSRKRAPAVRPEPKRRWYRQLAG